MSIKIIPESWAVVLAESIMMTYDADLTNKTPNDFRESLAKAFQLAYESGTQHKTPSLKGIQKWEI